MDLQDIMLANRNNRTKRAKILKLEKDYSRYNMKKSWRRTDCRLTEED